jgi:hypothetical protein
MAHSLSSLNGRCISVLSFSAGLDESFTSLMADFLMP